MAARHATPLAHRQFKTKGTLSPEEWAGIIVEEAHALGLKITPRQVAEGVATTQLESSGNASNEVQGPTGHIGGWAEGTEGFPSSPAERLDPRASTRAALKDWASNGKSWWPAWGKWEKEQSGHSGSESSQYTQYLGIAKRALGAAPTKGPRSGAPPAAASTQRAARGTEAESSSPSSAGGDLMHIGLIGVLVLGGAAMIGLGATRMLGTAQSGRA